MTDVQDNAKAKEMLNTRKRCASESLTSGTLKSECILHSTQHICRATETDGSLPGGNICPCCAPLLVKGDLRCCLAGPTLGKGPCWKLPMVTTREKRDSAESKWRCSEMFEQAVSCSKMADINFVFDDGKSLLSGHWAMICPVSEMFRGMYNCQMQETLHRQIRIVGITRESFRGFLEWVYCGNAGKEMSGADGREVWLLAERYQVKGLKNWLMQAGLDANGVCAAAQYAIEGDGEGRANLLKACTAKCASSLLGLIPERSLHGVCAHVVQEMLTGHAALGGKVFEPERNMARFRFIQRWANANGLRAAECDLQPLLRFVDLTKLPAQFLVSAVRPSGMVPIERLWELIEKTHNSMLQHFGSFQFRHTKSFGTQGMGAAQFLDVTMIAVGAVGKRQLMAASDCKNRRVLLFDVKSDECKALGAWPGAGFDGFACPIGVAFNKRGDLIVSDLFFCKIYVFSCAGELVRTFSMMGSSEGELKGPCGVAVNRHGEIVVCDQANHRVQVFRDDGTFVLQFGSWGRGEGRFDNPCGVAIGHDDSIIVADSVNSRVQVFSMLGTYSFTVGSKGTAPGQFLKPYSVAVGPGGEIFVADSKRGDVQMFSAEGVLMQSIGRKGDSKCNLSGVAGVAVDARGLVYMGNNDKDECSVIVCEQHIA